jgi:hypothetical protein
LSDHAKYSPSSLSRIQACPGSPNLIAKLPEDQRRGKDSPASLQGTLRHALLAEKFLAHTDPSNPTGVELPYTPTAADHAAAQLVWSWVESHPALRASPGHWAWSERRIEIGKWCGLPEGELWGTADLILVTPKTLTIADAKFGQRIVSPDSIQLKAYAVGAGSLLADNIGGFLPEFRGVREVELVILQPTAKDLVSSKTYPLEAMMDWATEVGDVVRATKDSAAELSPGDHCVFCPASTSCPARNGAAMGAIQDMFAVIGEPGPAAEPVDAPHSAGSPPLEEVSRLAGIDPTTLDADQLGRILDLAPVVEALFKDLRKRAEAMLKEGKPVDGWKLVEGRRAREWVQDPDATLAVLRSLGLKAEEIWKKELQTPAALDKIIAASGVKRRITKFGELWKWKEGKPTLAPESSPEPEWGKSKAPFTPTEQAESVEPVVEWM